MSEDCLFLNIWRPNGTTSSDSLPVAVWIHGGGFTSGAGSDWHYDGTNFATAHGMVVVTINYRLGPLGNLCTDTVCTTGMNGNLDQIVSLEWVQSHIASFGGDPTAVSIFGESAGALSVCMLSVSPRAAGLFHRAVLESGACFGLWGPNNATVGQLNGQAWLRSVNATSMDDLQNTTRFPSSVFEWGVTNTPTPSYGNPSTTTGVLAVSALSLYEAGSAHVTDIMIGSNTFDGLAPWLLKTLPSLPIDTATYDYLMNQQLTLVGITNSTHQAAVRAIYDADTYYNGSLDASIVAFTGDRDVVCPSLHLANLAAAAAQNTESAVQSAHTYVYGHLYGLDVSLVWGVLPADTYTQYPTWGPTYASHFSEVYFVFNNSGGFEGVPFSADEQCLADEIGGFWSSFMTNGKPATARVRSCSNNALVPPWPQANTANVSGMFLGMNMSVLASDYRASKCATIYPNGIPVHGVIFNE